MGFKIRKINVSSKVIRPRFFYEDLKTWFAPNEYDEFEDETSQIFFSSFCDDIGFLSFLCNSRSELIYVPLVPSREIKKASIFLLLGKKQLFIQFFLSLFFLRNFLQVLSVDSEIFLGKLPVYITKKKLELKHQLFEPEKILTHSSHLKRKYTKKTLYLLGYSYEHDVKAFGKKIIDRFILDLNLSSNNVLKLHPDTDIERYISGRDELKKLKIISQIEPNIPAEVILPFVSEVRTLGSRLIIHASEHKKKVVFYTSNVKKNCGSNYEFNLFLKKKIAHLENVYFIEL